MKTIAIVDDDLPISNMLAELLQKAGYAVLQAYSGTEALYLLSQHRPDLILLDLMLPGRSGEEILPEMAGIPVIVLSAKVDTQDKVRLLLGGAADYMTKPFDTKELLARITVQLRGATPHSPTAPIVVGSLQLDPASRTVVVGGQTVHLTKTECAILKLLMQNPKQVLAKSVILDWISLDTPDCTDSSLKQHISNLRKKLREADGREYIEAVWGIGFKLSTNNAQLRTLRSQRLRWERGDLELKDAIAGISHDLRTPLTAICGYLDLLGQEPLAEPAARYLAQIQNRTEALKALTEELFRYSIAASSQPLVPVPLDLWGALEEALLSFYGAMEQRNITPEIQLPESRVERCLDPSALSRIFSNILGNALKYSSGDLTVCMDQEGTIVFTNAAAGLTTVTVGRLFDRFYTVQTGSSSTGLGLSIAKLLTERMNGSIGAEYRDGKLSITLRFPPAES